MTAVCKAAVKGKPLHHLEKTLLCSAYIPPLIAIFTLCQIASGPAQHAFTLPPALLYR